MPNIQARIARKLVEALRINLDKVFIHRRDCSNNGWNSSYVTIKSPFRWIANADGGLTKVRKHIVVRISDHKPGKWNRASNSDRYDHITSGEEVYPYVFKLKRDYAKYFEDPRSTGVET